MITCLNWHHQRTKYINQRPIIISTGLKDVLPEIDNISEYYGKSLFNCPYCDGWELRDKPLVVIIGEQIQGFHFVQTIYNWPKDLIVCTNGKFILNSEQKRLIQNKGIKIIENKIRSFEGKNVQMEKIHFENGDSAIRKGGFVLPQPIQASDLAKKLGCEYNSLGGISVDFFGKTNVHKHAGAANRKKNEKRSKKRKEKTPSKGPC